MIKKFGLLLCLSCLIFGLYEAVSGETHTLASIVTLSPEERTSLVTKLKLGNEELDDVVSAYVMINTEQTLVCNEDGSPVRPTSGENLLRSILPSLSSSLDNVISVGDASHTDKSSMMEVVKVTATKGELLQLAQSELITDILGIQCCGSNTTEGFVSYDVHDARFIDTSVEIVLKEKTISLRKKYYDELLGELDAHETSEAHVVLYASDEDLNDFSESGEQKSDIAIQALISLFDVGTAQTTYRGHYSFSLILNKEIAQTLYDDSRVEHISSVYLSTHE